MQPVRFLSKMGSLISVLMIVLVAGCGSNKTNTVYVTAPASTYLVEYIPGMMEAAEGKTSFQIRVRTRSDGSAASGLADSITLTPMMHMSDMNHSAPVDVVTESGTAGTYDCTVYYLMASGPDMGYWELQVKIGTETATFYPSVSMAMMGSDTPKKSMYGPSDIFSMGTNTQYNYYFLFNDGMVSAATPTFKLYITHTEDNRMTFNPISTVSSPTGTVDSAIVSASTDSTFPETLGVTVPGTDDGNGHWSLPGLSQLSTAGTYTVYVKLQVNGEDKTKDGAAPSVTNVYQPFRVTSH